MSDTDTTQDTVEALKQKYRLDSEGVKAVEMVLKKVPLADLASFITDDFFLRQLIPLIVGGDPTTKLRGLELLLKWLGTQRKKPKERKVNLGM